MMKFLLPFVTIFICSSAYALQNKFELGIELGPNISTIRGSSLINSRHDPRIGFYVGASLQYNLSKHLSLRTGLGFERKGSSGESVVIDNSGTTLGTIHHLSNFDYLSIPILIRYSIGKRTKYFIGLGSFIGILLRQMDHNDGRPNFSKTSNNGTANFQSFDAGLCGEIGVSRPLSKKINISAQVRNNLGLLGLNIGPTFENKRIKTNATALLLGLSIGLHKAKEVAHTPEATF